MLRLVGFLVTFILGVAGFGAVDYTMAKRRGNAEDGADLSVGAYIGDLSGRLSGRFAPSTSSLPSALADMMPAAPAGWTVRPAVAEDMSAFLPKRRADAPLDARRYVEAVGKSQSGSGVDSVILTYEKAERRVVIKAVRYPDLIFTSYAAMAQRMKLQMTQPEFRGRDFMTVRGLDITEDVLPDGLRARYFMADAGAQIHLRVLATKRMTDEDLVPFFQTLHVKAMNASVIDKHAGLGDVPVLVVVSALDPETRDAYDADRAAREEAEAEKQKAERLAAEAEAILATDAAAVDRGSGLEGEGRLPMQDNNGTRDRRGDCEKRAGTKFCGVDGDQD